MIIGGLDRLRRPPEAIPRRVPLRHSGFATGESSGRALIRVAKFTLHAEVSAVP